MVLDFEKRKLIRLMGNEGFNIAEISAAIGVSRQTIYYEFQRCQMTLQDYDPEQAQMQAEVRKINKNRSVLNLEKRRKLKFLANEGCNISNIAKNLGVSYPTITNELKKNGMTLQNYDPEIAQKNAESCISAHLN